MLLEESCITVFFSSSFVSTKALPWRWILPSFAIAILADIGTLSTAAVTYAILRCACLAGGMANIATHIKHRATSTDPGKNLVISGSQENGAVNAATKQAVSNEEKDLYYKPAVSNEEKDLYYKQAVSNDAGARGNQPGEVPLNAIKRWGLTMMGATVCVTYTTSRLVV